MKALLFLLHSPSYAITNPFYFSWGNSCSRVHCSSTRSALTEESTFLNYHHRGSVWLANFTEGKEQVQVPLFQPLGITTYRCCTVFPVSFSNFGGRGRKATSRNMCGLLGSSSAGQTTWDRVWRRCFRVGRTDSSSAEGRRHERRCARVTVKTWQKPETAHEKSLSPRQRTNGIKLWNLSVLGRSVTESKATCNVYSNEQR